MKTSNRSSEQAVIDAMSASRKMTVADVAATAGVGRSTAAKALAKLEAADTAQRTPGGTRQGRHLPDRWSLTSRTKAPPRKNGPTAERLRPGQLDGLVLDHLQQNTGSALSPTSVAKALGRSSGAVANCLARLASTKRVRKTGDRPRRYTALQRPQPRIVHEADRFASKSSRALFS